MADRYAHDGTMRQNDPTLTPDANTDEYSLTDLSSTSLRSSGVWNGEYAPADAAAARLIGGFDMPGGREGQYLSGFAGYAGSGVSHVNGPQPLHAALDGGEMINLDFNNDVINWPNSPVFSGVGSPNVGSSSRPLSQSLAGPSPQTSPLKAQSDGASASRQVDLPYQMQRSNAPPRNFAAGSQPSSSSNGTLRLGSSSRSRPRKRPRVQPLVAPKPPTDQSSLAAALAGGDAGRIVASMSTVHHCRQLLQQEAEKSGVSFDLLCRLLNPDAQPSAGMTALPPNTDQRHSEVDPIVLDVDDPAQANGPFAHVIDHVLGVRRTQTACPAKPIRNQHLGYLPCFKCNKRLPDVTAFVRHLQQTSPYALRACPVQGCREVFHRVDNIPKHLVRDHGVDEAEASRQARSAQSFSVAFRGYCPFPDCEEHFEDFMELYADHFPTHFAKPRRQKADHKRLDGSSGDPDEHGPRDSGYGSSNFGPSRDAPGNPGSSSTSMKDSFGHGSYRGHGANAGYRPADLECLREVAEPQESLMGTDRSTKRSATDDAASSTTDDTTLTSRSESISGDKSSPREAAPTAQNRPTAMYERLAADLRRRQTQPCRRSPSASAPGQKIYRCPRACGARFAAKGLWLHHIRSADPSSLHQCRSCHEFFCEKSALRFHYFENPEHYPAASDLARTSCVYNGVRRRTCGFCGHRADEWDAFWEVHVASHFESKGFEVGRWRPAFWDQIRDDASTTSTWTSQTLSSAVSYDESFYNDNGEPGGDNEADVLTRMLTDQLRLIPIGQCFPSEFAGAGAGGRPRLSAADYVKDLLSSCQGMSQLTQLFEVILNLDASNPHEMHFETQTWPFLFECSTYWSFADKTTAWGLIQHTAQALQVPVEERKVDIAKRALLRLCYENMSENEYNDAALRAFFRHERKAVAAGGASAAEEEQQGERLWCQDGSTSIAVGKAFIPWQYLPKHKLPGEIAQIKPEYLKIMPKVMEWVAAMEAGQETKGMKMRSAPWGKSGKDFLCRFKAFSKGLCRRAGIVHAGEAF